MHIYKVFWSYLPSFWSLTCHLPKSWSTYQDHIPEKKKQPISSYHWKTSGRGGGLWTPLLHARMSTGLTLCRACEDRHGSYEFMSIMTLGVQKTPFHIISPPPTVFSSYSLLWWSLSLGVCEICFWLWWELSGHFLSADWPFVSVLSRLPSTENTSFSVDGWELH